MNPNQVFTRIWAAFDDGEIMIACAWCGRVRLDGGWFRPPFAVVEAIDVRLAFSHSICDECADEYLSPPASVSTAAAHQTRGQLGPC